jgi:hypothetical protein
MVIVASANLIFVFFFFPETQYRRPNPSSSTDLSTVDSGNDSSSEKGTKTVATESSPMIAKKSYLQSLSPWSGINPGSTTSPSFLFLLIRPWPLTCYPAVIYAFLVFSFNLGCILFCVSTAPVIFQSPPYNFSPGVQSLINLPAFIGAGLGAFVGGAMTDALSGAVTRRNGGIFEPESRLLALVLPAFLVPAGVLMYFPCP